MRSEKEAIYNELLALRCRRREKDALEQLIRTWEKRLFYYIRRLVDVEEDAWDILQQTWLKVLRGIGKLREPRSLPPGRRRYSWQSHALKCSRTPTSQRLL